MSYQAHGDLVSIGEESARAHSEHLSLVGLADVGLREDDTARGLIAVSV